MTEGGPGRQRAGAGGRDGDAADGVPAPAPDGAAVSAEPTGRTVSVGRTMFWMMAGTLTYLGAQWLLTVLVVRLTGSQHLNGDYNLALNASSVAYAVVLFGMRPFQISDTRGEFRDAVYLASRVATSVLATVVFGATLAVTADVGRLWPVLLLFLAFRLTEGWMDVLHGVLQNADRMDLAGIAMIARAVGECLAFAGVLAVTQNIAAAVAALLAVSFLATIGLEWRWARPRLDGVRFSDAGGWPRTVRLLRTCSPLLVANLAYSVMLFWPRNAVQSIWGAELFGFYASISAPLLLVPVLVSYLYTPFMPQLAELELSGRRRDLLLLAGKLALAIGALVVVAFVLLPYVGPPVLALMFGPSVLDHLDLLLPVAASVTCTAAVYFGNAVLTAVRRMPLTLAAAVVALLIVLVSSDALVRTYGPNGASFALIAGQTAQALVLAVGFLLPSRPRG